MYLTHQSDLGYDDDEKLLRHYKCSLKAIQPSCVGVHVWYELQRAFHKHEPTPTMFHSHDLWIIIVNSVTLLSECSMPTDSKAR